MKTLFCGKIITMNDQQPEACFLVVEDDKITYVGNNLKEENFNRIIDVEDKIIMPGLIDTHTHFYEFAKRRILVDLSPAKSVKELEEILLDFKKKLDPELEWIGGSGWNKNIYPDLEGFDKTLLDKIFPDLPASFESKDFHSKWCNSLALERARIDKNTPDPPGGMLGRYENGEPNGFTYEKAWDLIDRAVPDLPIQVQERIVRDSVSDCYKMGLVGVHFMEREKQYHLYNKLLDDGLMFRFCWHFPSEILNNMIELGVKSYSGNEWMKIGGQKIFMDGAVGSQTAYMYEAYPNSDNFGTFIFEKEILNEIVEKGVDNGISSSIHAIGDKCVSIVTDVLLNNLNKGLMHRIEHLQCARDEDLAKLNGSGIFAAVQPIHIKEDIDTLQIHWPKAQLNTYRFKTMLENNIELGFGSDAPVETINPMLGIYAAIERKKFNNPMEVSWMPEEKLDVQTAIKGYTLGGAKASRSEKVRGSLEVGKKADIIVIDDFSNKENSFWLDAKSYLTMIDGNIVFSELETT